MTGDRTNGCFEGLVMKNSIVMMSAAIGLGLLAGCAGRPSLLPNSDPNLRLNSAQLAADGAKRHPFKSEAPKAGNALATAQFDTTFATVQILNYGDEDWHDVEVWVNQKYVVFIPQIDKDKKLVKTIPFQMLFDDSGNWFSTNGGKNPIASIEILRDGKMYNVPFKAAD